MTSWADNMVESCFPRADLRGEPRCCDLKRCAFQKDFPGRCGYKGMLRGAKPAPSPDAFGLGTAAFAADSG